MTVFVLAQLTFKDRTAYNRYQDRFMPILIEFGGRLLAADERPETVEGIWEGDKVVLISFKSRRDFAAWSRLGCLQGDCQGSQGRCRCNDYVDRWHREILVASAAFRDLDEPVSPRRRCHAT